MKITITITIDEDESDYEPKHTAPEYTGPRFPNGQPAQNKRGEPLDNLGQVIPLIPSGVQGTHIGWTGRSTRLGEVE